MKEFSFGGIQSPPDYRDIPFAAAAAVTDVPDSYSPAWANKLPVWHQRKLGACIGHAFGKARQKTEYQELNKMLPFSARFLYALAKSQDGYPFEGTYPRLVAKILKDTGCCTEKYFVNDTTLSHAEYIDVSKIPAEAYDEAKKYRIDGYSFVANDPAELKKAIYYAGETRRDLAMLLNVGNEWWTSQNGTTSWNAADIIPVRPPKVVVSGHEIFPYAYETINGRLSIWFLNSWSEAWGLNGRGWFWYDEYAQYIKETIVAIDLPDTWQNQIDNLPPANKFSHNFTRDIVFGEKSDEVKALQTALMIDNEFSKTLYADLLKQTQLGYYGNVTKQAVLNFQKKYSVASIWELLFLGGKKVGPKSRVKLNELFNK